MHAADDVEQEFTRAERRRLRQLLDEDAIRKLAIDYAHCLDHGYVDRLRDLFTPDIQCHFGPYGEWHGIDSVISNFKAVYSGLGDMPFASLHAGSGHWIDLMDDNNARGRRQLLDFLLTRPGNESPILWLAIYDETYQRADGRWRISSISIELLWPERLVSKDFPKQFPSTGTD